MTAHGPSGSAQVEAIVDAAATLAKILRRTARRSGFSGRRLMEAVLADGEKAVREFGSIELETVSQRDAPPVTVREVRELVAYTALEILGSKVSPTTRMPEPSLPIWH